MKKIIILAFLIGSAFLVSAQLVLSSGSQIVVNSTSVLVVNDVTTAGGTIKNLGEVSVLGDITNNNGDLFHTESVGTITFEGSSAQEITGTSSTVFKGSVIINNSSGVALTSTSTGADQSIPGSLTFTSGKLTLNGFHLTLGGTADPTGVGSSAYIVTNGAGQLKRILDGTDTDILFPVGNAAYNPLILNNNTGTSDTYGVIAVDSKPASFSGTTHIVNESWDVTEAVADGSNLTVTTQWNSSDEATFDRTRCSLGLTTDAGENVTWGAIGAASGSDPYTKSITGITSVGTFMVGDYFYAGLPIDIKVILAAAWNDANNNMDKTINSRIPLADPYTGVDVTASSIPADAVDWVKVELRNSGNHATVTNTYAKFVDQDGQIIEEDGSNMKITGAVLGSYYVAVHHRNHLGVVSASTVNLSETPSVNFTNSLANAWDDATVTTNDAMKEVESGTFGLWPGDANGDGVVSYNSGDNDRISVLNALSAVPGAILSDTYNANDVNMDQDVGYNAGDNDRIYILNSLSAVPGATLNQHIPE